MRNVQGGILNFKIKEQQFDIYLYWINERMNIFWRRLEDNPVKIQKYMFGSKKIWTEDTIFQNYKFTNVYRSLDRVSQYLINNVIYERRDFSEEEVLFRILFFKLFNKIETWELFKKEYGYIDNSLIYERWSELDNFVINKLNENYSLFSNAYVLSTAVKDEKYHHRKYLLSYKKYIFDNFDNFVNVNSLEELFGKFISIPYIGNFLAMQFTIDCNYSEVFSFNENEFIIPGPGALRGIDRCFEGQKTQGDYIEIIKWVQENFDNLMKDAGYDFKSLPNRKPTLIDLQNCFCETDKYLRGLGQTQEGILGKRIKQNFKETSKKIEYCFPSKWGVNF